MNARAVSRVVAVCALIVIAAGGAVADREPFGDSLSTEHYGRTRSVDVEHYKLDLTFDPERSEVRGTSSITVRPLNDGLTVVELDAGEMDVERVTLDVVEGSERLQFRHEGDKLRIELPRSYGEDESVTLNVTYAARPRRGLYFVGPDKGYPDKPAQVWSQGEDEDSRYWFPSYDYPNDRATTEEIYTVPAEWKAMGNGTLVETTEDSSAETRTFRYRMDTPHVAYLISVVAGEFETYTDDFDGIPVEYLVPPGTGEETTLRAFGPTPGMLAFFSERTGVRYPYSKYAQTCAVDFIYGGMENISATTQTAETLRDARAALETDSWGLVAHEAAHQWFGDLLTCANWSHAWLNEGFATYWENLWWEHEHGTDEFLWRMLQDRDSYLEEDREQYRRPIVSQLYTDPMDVFDSHLYPKGAWVLHMIRGVLGDEAFFKAIQHYTKKHRNGIVETVDLRRAIAEATGLDMERFFDQWLRHGGHPEFRMTQSWDPESSTLTLRIEQTQQVDELTPLFALPVSIAVDTAAGTVHHRLSVEQTVHEVTLRLDAEPSLVRFDPDFRVLYEMEWERPVEETLQALATDPNPVGRIFAARQLADRVAEHEAAEALAASVTGDAFFGVRIEAARALGQVQGDVARAALIRTLAADPDARVRTSAAEALGAFRHDEQVAGALEQVPTSEKAYGTYAAAIGSLASIEAPAARKVAIGALDVDSHGEQVRAAALRALGEIGGAEALATLREWTVYGTPARARTAAIAALPRLARQEEAEDATIRLLLDLLDDPYIWARGGAMDALAELGAREALDRLERSAEVEPDSRLRRTARRAIESINEEESSGKTVEELAAEIERLRRDMRRQSGRLQDLEKQAP